MPSHHPSDGRASHFFRDATVINQTRFLQLGWLLFATVAIIAVAGGFQAPAEKLGVADITQLVDNSDFGKQVKGDYQRMKTARESVLEFIDANRVLTLEQATRIRDLNLKPTLTDAEKAELETVKAEVIAANKKWTELATKKNLTPEDRTLLDEYADRSQKMNDLGNRWVRQFTSDMDTWLDGQKVESMKRARAAIQQVAKEQSYTLVLESGVAPYGANDVTTAALAAMNAQK